MDNSHRTLDILLFNDVNILDVAGPVQAFFSAERAGVCAYTIRFVTTDGKPVRASCGLRLTPDDIAALDSPADDLIIPGGMGVDAMLGNTALKTLIAEWLSSREHGRIISVCSGALLLANAGELDGKKATTHWERSEKAPEIFPNVDWKLDQLYVFDGQIMTSAGVTAGIDLALAIIRQDCGAEIALNVARELVVYLQRSGGQSQFTQLLEAQFSTNGSLSKLVDAIIEYPEKSWGLDQMADYIGMTPRTLSRKFTLEIGTSPVKFLEQVRVKRACDTICAGMPIQKVIGHCGFGDFQRMQRAFKRHLGTTIGDYSKRFSAPDAI
jgi:transcriptional regulator GlxA family with amidase domain